MSAPAFLVAGLCALFAMSENASAKTIYFVEEHWELVVLDPDPDLTSPQVSFFVFPNRNDDSNYFELQLNYAADASTALSGFSGGGFRVTAVTNDQAIQYRRSNTTNKWSVDNDRIRWTTVLAASNGLHRFAIKNGESTDWGNFGGPEYLVEMEDTQGLGLSQYHPSASLSNVDLGFGGNRVKSICLRSVTVVFTDGTRTEVNYNEFVHGSNDQS